MALELFGRNDLDNDRDRNYKQSHTTIINLSTNLVQKTPHLFQHLFLDSIFFDHPTHVCQHIQRLNQHISSQHNYSNNTYILLLQRHSFQPVVQVLQNHVDSFHIHRTLNIHLHAIKNITIQTNYNN